MTTPAKTAVMLLSMGGPDSLEAVKPFLFNLFSDPDIIRLPLSFLFQKPLAWLIVNNRGEEAKRNYGQMGGKSPQLPITLEQRDALRAELKSRGHDMPVYVAMRYWHPFTEEAVAQAVQDGITELIVLPLYPHYSYTTTGSSINALRRVLAKQAPHITTKTACSYHTHPKYLSAVAETIRHALDNNAWGCPAEKVQILFSAHGLPVNHVKRTKDPYPEQILECVQSLMQVHFAGQPWELAFQSRVGKMQWLGPYTDGVLSFFAGKNIDNVLMVPVSFVSDHVETLVEMDIQFVELAKDQGIKHIHRASALNTNQQFIQCLANLVEVQINSEPDDLSMPVTPKTLEGVS